MASKTVYETRYGDQAERKVNCHRCKKKRVSIRVDPRHTSRVRVLCGDCKKREHAAHNTRTETEETDHLLQGLARNMLLNHGASEVKVFKPGDRGFKQRAQEFFENRRAERQKAYHFNTFGRGV